jgi:hypothetical protein
MDNPGDHVMMFYEWHTPKSSMWVIEATPDTCRKVWYDTTYLVDHGYVPRRYKWVNDPGQQDPVITDSLHCKNPQGECASCFHHGDERTIEISAYDPDGDPLHYVWWCNYGYFIVGGNPVAICTTQVNYVIYQAPSEPWWDQDNLFVDVCDNRGGSAQDDGTVDLFDPGYSCICGDINYSQKPPELGDVVFLIEYLYKSGPPLLEPTERADVNNSCAVEMGDIVYLISYLYKNGPHVECCWIH